jgi:hypothetical protein
MPVTTPNVRAASRLATRRVELYGATSPEGVLHHLERLGLSPERAQDALAFSIVRGDLVERTEHGRTVIVKPRDWRQAA